LAAVPVVVDLFVMLHLQPQMQLVGVLFELLPPHYCYAAADLPVVGLHIWKEN
jgi:hypothetical protein